MPIQVQLKPSRLRSDSCSSAEIRTSLVTAKDPVHEQETIPTIRQARRRVAFNGQVSVRTIEHINDKDDEEVDNTWYKKAEYRIMCASFAVTVRKIVSNTYKGDCEDHCARGLEFRSPVASQRRKMNKLDSFLAVLDEQKRQRMEDDENPEALACVYIQSNLMCGHEASQRGELDGEEALRLLKTCPAVSRDHNV